MSIQEATDSDFRLTGKTLTINKHGYTLVFFKMANCEGCKSFAPIFHNLSMSTSKINNFVVIDVSVYRRVVQWSRESSTPIQKVPYIVLYFDGKPHSKYTGIKDIPNLLSFIDKTVPDQQRHGQQGFINPSYPPPQQQRGYGYGGHPGMQPQPEPTQRGGARPPPNYAQLNDVEDDDDEKLLLPGLVTPHNVPWEGSYRKIGVD